MKAEQCATSFSSVVRGEQYKKHNIRSGSFSAGTAVIDLSQVDRVGGFLWTWLSCIKECKISTIISNWSHTTKTFVFHVIIRKIMHGFCLQRHMLCNRCIYRSRDNAIGRFTGRVSWPWLGFRPGINIFPWSTGTSLFAGVCEKDLDRAAGECTCNFLLGVSVTDSSNDVLGDFFVFSGQPV